MRPTWVQIPVLLLISSFIHSSHTYIEYLLNAGTVSGTGEISENQADTVPTLTGLLTQWTEMGTKLLLQEPWRKQDDAMGQMVVGTASTKMVREVCLRRGGHLSQDPMDEKNHVWEAVLDEGEAREQPSQQNVRGHLLSVSFKGRLALTSEGLLKIFTLGISLVSTWAWTCH